MLCKSCLAHGRFNFSFRVTSSSFRDALLSFTHVQLENRLSNEVTHGTFKLQYKRSAASAGITNLTKCNESNGNDSRGNEFRGNESRGSESRGNESRGNLSLQGSFSFTVVQV